MRDLISVIVLVAAIWGGTKTMGVIYDTVRRAALEKAAQGLSPLPRFSQVKSK